MFLAKLSKYASFLSCINKPLSTTLESAAATQQLQAQEFEAMRKELERSRKEKEELEERSRKEIEVMQRQFEAQAAAMAQLQASLANMAISKGMESTMFRLR